MQLQFQDFFKIRFKFDFNVQIHKAKKWDSNLQLICHLDYILIMGLELNPVWDRVLLSKKGTQLQTVSRITFSQLITASSM